MAVAVTYVGTNVKTTGASSYTFTSEPVGSAAAGRRTVVVVAYIQNGTGTTPPTMTIGGASATADVTSFGVDSGVSSRAFCGVYGVGNPSGTTATIVVTCSTASYDCTIFVYSVVGSNTVIDTATVAPALGSAVTTGSLDVDTQTGGAVLAGAMIYDSSIAGPVTWAGVTSDANTVVYTDDRRGVASAQVVSGATPRTVTVTYPQGIGGLDSFTALAVSYDPAAAPAGGATRQMMNYRQRRV
jgi:hypothetical protein